MHPVQFDGVAVYKAGDFWRISYAGCILRLESDRTIAEGCGNIYANYFNVKARVFEPSLPEQPKRAEAKKKR